MPLRPSRLLVCAAVAAAMLAACGEDDGVYDAGPVEDFPPGSVTTLVVEDGEERTRYIDGTVVPGTAAGDLGPRADPGTIIVHLVRLEGGELLALYAKDPHLGCTVPWNAGFEFQGETGWFRNPCHLETYDRTGRCHYGPCPRGLDRFPVEIEGGRVLIRLDLGALIEGERRPGTSGDATPPPTATPRPVGREP